MSVLGDISYHFVQHGKEVESIPENVRSINHPRSGTIRWLIGESEIFQEESEKILAVAYDEKVLALIELFEENEHCAGEMALVNGV
jgi:hypothetical protein